MGTTTKTVAIPNVVIVMKEEQVQVPVIDVDMPREDKMDRSIVVKVEVTDNEYDLYI